MASLISRLQKRYIVEGDQLAHDAETVIGELCAALRKANDNFAAVAGLLQSYPRPSGDLNGRTLLDALEHSKAASREIDASLQKCAEGI